MQRAAVGLLREIFAKCDGCGRRMSLIDIWREMMGEGVILEHHPTLGGWFCLNCWHERADHSRCNLCNGKLEDDEIGVCRKCFPKVSTSVRKRGG